MAWIMPVLGGVLDVMSAITFIQFIEEEAIQACQLGAYMAFREKRYKAAARAMQVTRNELLYHLKMINEIVGTLAPYSYGAFHDFITATETTLDVYDELLWGAAMEAKAK